MSTYAVEFLDNDKFYRIVKKYQGDRYVKHFTCWNQLLAMMLAPPFEKSGQLSNRESLRDLILALDAHSGKLYHLGMGRNVFRTNLSTANNT